MKNEIKNNFLIGVVIYQIDICESSTLISLLKIKDKLNQLGCKIFVWDNGKNGQKPCDIELFQKKFSNFKYNHTPENISLAKIYNKIFETNIKYKYLILFDHDSEITLDYFNKISISTNDYPHINLFLPIIRVGDLIVSPANRFLVTGRYWKEERKGLVNSKNKLAITSGMVISMEYMKKVFKEFNEKLDLYGIDTHFMIQYEKTNTHFFVLNYTMKHDLSYFTEENVEKKLFRFHNHKKSLKIIYKKEGMFLNIVARLFVLGSALKLSIRNKTIRFLMFNESKK